MRNGLVTDVQSKTSTNLCSMCGCAAILLVSGGVTLGIWAWNVFGMCQEVRSSRCEKNTTGSFLIWIQTLQVHVFLCVPAMSLSLSIFLWRSLCLSVSLCQNPVVQLNLLHIVKNQLPHCKAQRMRMKSANHDSAPVVRSPSHRATKVKPAWLLQPTCTTARSLQGECVCVFVLKTAKAAVWHFLVQRVPTWSTLTVPPLTCKDILYLNASI